MNALVTGGSGFLGSNLVTALAQAGHVVRILDPVTPDRLPEGITHLVGSVTDPVAVRRALEGIDCVYHLAGIAHLWTPRREDFDRVNRYGTVVMLAGAREMGVRRFVHCSSSTVLLPRRTSALAINEAVAVDSTHMAGPYSRSKFFAEEVARAAAAAGQDVVIVSPTVLVGPHDRNFTPPTAMLAHFLSARRSFYLETVLNLAHVQDVALGMMLAVEHGRAGERYILGGENLSLSEVLDVIEQVSQRAERRVRIPWGLAVAAGYTAEMISTYITHRTPQATREGVRLALRSAPFDIGKARRELGYAPRPARTAIAEAIQWLLTSISARTAEFTTAM